MCVLPKKWCDETRCALMYHSKELFLLSSSNYNDIQGKNDVKNWKPASEVVIKRIARYIARMKAMAA
jgi:hypothetical protein